MTTTYDPRRVAYVKVRMAVENLQRVTAPITRRRYSDAERDAALDELEKANAEYRAVESV